MKNLRDFKTKIMPSKTRGGKELLTSSALDSPSILSRLSTPPPTIQCDMSQVMDTTSAIDDTHDDATTLLDEPVPLDDFLDAQIAKAKESEIDENYDSPITPRTPRTNMLNVPKGYVMDGEIAKEFLACNDSDDLKKLRTE